MKMEELEVGKKYMTCWGFAGTFIGMYKTFAYYEELDRHISDSLAEFDYPDGRGYYSSHEVEWCIVGAVQ